MANGPLIKTLILCAELLFCMGSLQAQRTDGNAFLISKKIADSLANDIQSDTVLTNSVITGADPTAGEFYGQVKHNFKTLDIKMCTYHFKLNTGLTLYVFYKGKNVLKVIENKADFYNVNGSLMDEDGKALPAAKTMELLNLAESLKALVVMIL